MVFWRTSKKSRQPEVIEQDGHLRIFGFNKYLSKDIGKNALLCYLPQTIAAELHDEATVRFSNEGIGRSWPRVLNELGYVVDIISWDDKKFVPSKDYDLAVFHGGKNFHKIYPKLTNKPPIIHFLTGTYWRLNNAQEDRRLKDFESRHKIKLPRDRYIQESEDEVNETTKGIIVIGNKFTAGTFRKYPSVIPVKNANYPDDHFNKIKKNYSKARNNFLFFAGAGNVHKGLDLVIDAFKNLQQDLYIIAPLEKDFLKAYKNEAKLKNIHFIGEVPMRTEKFYEILDKCAFQIFPSCSEGQPGSVVEGMNQGLIPVVSKESGLDADRYGVILNENTIDCIKKSVRQMSALDPDLVEAMAKKVRKIALKEHNPSKFRKDLKKAVQKIVENT
jgi:glycosyltransferase involved in cell wall biosynthesis